MECPPPKTTMSGTKRIGYTVVSAGLAAIVMSASAVAQESALSRIDWVSGPALGSLGDIAEVPVPENCRFTDGHGAKQLLELTQNPASGDEQGALLCRAAADSSYWFVIFTFDQSGLVKDNEKASLDQAALLKTIQRSTDYGNEERRNRGWTELEVTGWERAPYYDSETHNLTWATRVRSKRSGHVTINHSVRLLGRRGVMRADLVIGPSLTASAIPAFDSLLTKYEFVSGQRYSEWRAGDKVAEYGLTALIAGGAGAAAVKFGLFGKLWKLILAIVLAVKKAIVVAIVAVAGFFKKLFRKGDKPTKKTPARTPPPVKEWHPTTPRPTPATGTDTL